MAPAWENELQTKKHLELLSPRPVLPCFIMTSETGKLDGYSLSRFICQVIGDNALKCVQETKNLWRIYCKKKEDRVTVITEGISINGKHVKVHGQNPYVVGTLNAGLLNDGEEVEMIKVTIKDIYNSVSNDVVIHFLTKILKLQITSEIQTGFYRDSRGGLTSLENGDRIIWIHPDQLKDCPLPRNSYCGGRPVRIFHRNQFQSDGECFKTPQICSLVISL